MKIVICKYDEKGKSNTQEYIDIIEFLGKKN